jgi:hypothetical protein
MLWAHKGDKVALSSYVSTGKAGFATPTGSYAVLTKLLVNVIDDYVGQ